MTCQSWQKREFNNCTLNHRPVKSAKETTYSRGRRTYYTCLGKKTILFLQLYVIHACSPGNLG